MIAKLIPHTPSTSTITTPFSKHPRVKGKPSNYLIEVNNRADTTHMHIDCHLNSSAFDLSTFQPLPRHPYLSLRSPFPRWRRRRGLATGNIVAGVKFGRKLSRRPFSLPPRTGIFFCKPTSRKGSQLSESMRRLTVQLKSNSLINRPIPAIN